MLRRGSGNCLLVQSKGAIDPQFFWLLGASTKRESESAIGMFGTGLKYAIPVLMRNDVNFEVRIGTGDLIFKTKEVPLNGTIFHQIEAVYEKDGKQEIHSTSLTLTLGKDWDVAHAIREIVSNAIDQGSFDVIEAPWHLIDRHVVEGRTSFIIDIDSVPDKEVNKTVRQYVDDLPKNFLVLNKKKGEPIFTGKLSSSYGGDFKVYKRTLSKDDDPRGLVYRRGVYVGDYEETEYPSMYVYDFASISVDELRRSPDNSMYQAVAKVLKMFPANLLIEVLKESCNSKLFESEAVRINVYGSIPTAIEKELDEILQKEKTILVNLSIEDYAQKKLEKDGYKVIKVSDAWYKNAFSKSMVSTYDNLYEKTGKDLVECEGQEYTKEIKDRIAFIAKILRGNTAKRYARGNIRIVKHGSIHFRVMDKMIYIREDVIKTYPMKDILAELLITLREKESSTNQWYGSFVVSIAKELIDFMAKDKKMTIPK